MAKLTIEPLQLNGFDSNNIFKLNAWTYRFVEELKYVLGNIELENMTLDSQNVLNQGGGVDVETIIEKLVNAGFLKERKADEKYIETEVFKAAVGEIETLKTNSLTADSAIIGTILSNQVEVTGTLTAFLGDFDKFSSKVGEIDTLIFGSASGTTIQTEFANSVIAQLGNAQIKSAMIKDISASKILSGDILTNNVRVVSEDGKLVISDETIQISDDNRVRVQIGKDASNDYSINVWDVKGNLMFSKGGITDKAIKDAIIRDDMVAENANISAGKLDIHSLFEEINGSKETLKSSLIYLDDKKQSLDVAFTSMDSKIDNIEVGGRNYIINSSGKEKKGFFANFSTVDADGYCKHQLKSKSQYSGVSVKPGFLINPREYPVGEKVVFSYDIMYTEWNFPEGTDHHELWMGQRYTTQTVSGGSTTGQYKGVTKHNLPVVGVNGCELNEWFHVEQLLTIPEPAAEGIADMAGILLYNSNVNIEASITFKLRNVKLEYGNKATDWTPALEDTEAELKSQGTQLSLLQGQISSKIWQQDITTAVDNINVGGRNLIRNSNFKNGDTYWTADYGTKNVINDSKYGKCLQFLLSSGTPRIYVETKNVWESGETYAYSFYAKASENSTIQPSRSLIDLGTKHTVTTEWQRFEGIIFSKDTVEDGTLSFKTKYNITYYIANVKLEKGNKATDWTPAPEDTESDLATLSTKYSTLDQTLNGFKTEVGKDYSKKVYHTASGSSGAKGYVGIAQLEITNGYANAPITFSLKNRGTNGSDVEVRFANVNSLDPGLVSLRENGNVGVWIVKLDTSKWQLIAKKSEGHDAIHVDGYSSPRGGVNITWTNTYYDTLPTTNITESTKLVGSAEASTIAKTSDVTAVRTIAEQTAEKFNWVVESGTSSSDFTLTDRMAELTAEIISLNGDVKVNGDMLVDGSITADKIDVDDLFAEDIYVAGAFNAEKTLQTNSEKITTGYNISGDTITFVEDYWLSPNNNGNHTWHMRTSNNELDYKGLALKRMTYDSSGDREYTTTYSLSRISSYIKKADGSYDNNHTFDISAYNITIGSSLTGSTRIESPLVDVRGQLEVTGTIKEGGKSLYQKYASVNAEETYGYVTPWLIPGVTFSENELLYGYSKLKGSSENIKHFGGALQINTTSALSDEWRTICELPQEARPSQVVRTFASLYVTNTSRFATQYAINILTNGEVIMLGSVTASSSYRILIPTVYYV